MPVICYAAIAWLYFGAATDWTRSYLGTGADPLTISWFIAWWPFAIAHGLNPFISRYVWFPNGFNLTWATSVPAAALFGLPVTAWAGPLAAFNLLSLGAPVLSAWTAFLLCKRLSGSVVAALFGGYLFGFSSYECGQLLGHLNLDSTFLVPLAVLLGVKRIAGDLGRLGFVARLAAVLLVQLAISTEVFATLCIFGALSWIIFLAFAPAPDRAALRALGAEIAIALMLMACVALPFLVFMVKGLRDVPGMINSVTAYSAEPLNYVIPTTVTYFGQSLAPLAHRLAGGNPSEQGAYLGIPLILAIAMYFHRDLHLPHVGALLVTLLAIVVASFGPAMQVLGINTHLPLPWAIVGKLPLIRSALPGRFTMYVWLAAGIVSALYLSRPAGRRARWWRLALVGTACVVLVPNTRLFAWTPLPVQSFFTPDNIARAIGAGRNVLILPFGGAGGGMAWQIASDMRFTQSGGYAGFTPASEHSYAILGKLAHGQADATFANEMSAYCGLHGVDYVLAAPSTPEALIVALKTLAWPQRLDHGVRVIAVPPSSALSYYAITGDIWPSAAPENWMGHSVRVVTHRQAVRVTLDGKWQPAFVVNVTAAGPSGRITYPIAARQTVEFDVPADAALTLTADSTFAPDTMLHNGDRRSLSVLIAVAKAP